MPVPLLFLTFLLPVQPPTPQLRPPATATEAQGEPDEVADADEAAATLVEEIDVFDVAPIHGLGLPRSRATTHLQQLDAEQLQRPSGLGLVNRLESRLPSVVSSDVQGNPIQQDLQYRGFTASPLLGAAQGMSIYQDGVRVNEPFGDTVNWALLPELAIAELTLVSGSNPVFGRNTLGGSLSLRTRSGFTPSERGAHLETGSFEHRLFEVDGGGHGERFGLFGSGRYFEEEGWRDFSDSRALQLFLKGEVRGERSQLELSTTAADTLMTGNGASPIELLALRREAVFTHPDESDNRLLLPVLYGQHLLSPTVELSASLFVRDSRIDTLNGDQREEDDDEEEGEEEDDDDLFDAVDNRTHTDQLGHGANLQLTVATPLGRRDNHLAIGLVWDEAEADFAAESELATLTPDRGTIGSGLIDPESLVDLETDVRHLALYVTDTLAVGNRLSLHLGARYNDDRVVLRDRLGDALDGNHDFSRLDPALGLVAELGRGVALFTSYARASRVPTPVELTCADPLDPCRLPNAFVADPPLEAVETSTFELGLRRARTPFSWSLALFHSRSRDDLIFVSSGSLTGSGHFANVEETRRQGAELAARGSAGRLTWFLAYGLLDASFETDMALPSPHHPEGTGGEIQVRPGDRLPGLPRHQGKLGIDATWDRVRLGTTVRASSPRVFRGDEANLLEPVSGFAVVGIHGSWRPTDRLELGAELTNLFDREYATFGLLGDGDEVLGEGFSDPRFLTPAPPRALRVGLAVSF